MGDCSAGRPDVRRTASDRIRRLAALQRRRARLESAQDAELDAVRRRYSRRLTALHERAGVLEAELEGLCRRHRAAVFPAGRKSWVTPFGKVSFRKAEPRVELQPSLEDAEVCRLLRRSRLGRLVRVLERPDRSAMRRELAEGRLSAARLERCGLAVTQPPERFRLTVAREPAAVGPGEGSGR
jgi:phage host-nuclease inhibitor protein Gam